MTDHAQRAIAHAVEELAESFAYLDGLRDSCTTNMYMAAPYLETVFGYDRGEAKDILRHWERTYDGGGTPDERAQRATRS